MNSINRNIEKNKEEMAKINHSNSMSAKISEMEDNLKTRKEKVAQLKSGYNPEAIKDQRKQLEIQKKKADEKLKEASQAMQLLNMHAAQRAELHHINKKKEEAERIYAEKLSECEDEMEDVLGHSPNPETAKSELEN